MHKREDKEHDEHVHDESNFRRKAHVCDCKKEKLSVNFYGLIGTFKNGALRITYNGKDFISEDTIEEEVKKLSDDVIQAIENNEAIAATDASVNDEIMTGAWIIEDDYRINRCKSEWVSNQWIQNTVIAAEAMIMLDLVTTVVKIGANEK